MIRYDKIENAEEIVNIGVEILNSVNPAFSLARTSYRGLGKIKWIDRNVVIDDSSTIFWKDFI